MVQYRQKLYQGTGLNRNTNLRVLNHKTGFRNPNHGTGMMMMMMMMILPYQKENYYQNKYTYTATCFPKNLVHKGQ
jgi:hypothetical protein